MIPFKINNQPFLIPSGWHELTLDQYVRLRNEFTGSNTDVLLEILSGLSKEMCYNASLEDVELLVIPALQWMEERLAVESLPVPEKINIEGVGYDIISDIGKKTYGQKIALQKAMEDCIAETGDLINCLTFAIAVYYYPIVTKEIFNEDEAREFAKIIGKLKLTEAYPVADFFFSSLIKSALLNQKNLEVKQTPTLLRPA